MLHKKLVVILDTNVLVSAFLWRKSDFLREIYLAVKHQRFIIVVCNEIIDELVHVFQRDSILKPLGKTKKQAETIVRGIVRVSSKVSIAHVPLQLESRDTDDNMFLVCALVAQADFLVTGDKDLLVLKKQGKTLIVTPRQFVEILQTSKRSV